MGCTFGLEYPPDALDIRNQTDIQKKKAQEQENLQHRLFQEQCYQECIKNIKKTSKDGYSCVDAYLSDEHIEIFKKQGYTVEKLANYECSFTKNCRVCWS